MPNGTSGLRADLEGVVIDPGYDNAAICCFVAEQGASLFKLPIP